MRRFRIALAAAGIFCAGAFGIFSGWRLSGAGVSLSAQQAYSLVRSAADETVHYDFSCSVYTTIAPEDETVTDLFPIQIDIAYSSDRCGEIEHGFFSSEMSLSGQGMYYYGSESWQDAEACYVRASSVKNAYGDWQTAGSLDPVVGIDALLSQNLFSDAVRVRSGFRMDYDAQSVCDALGIAEIVSTAFSFVDLSDTLDSGSAYCVFDEDGRVMKVVLDKLCWRSAGGSPVWADCSIEFSQGSEYLSIPQEVMQGERVSENVFLYNPQAAFSGGDSSESELESSEDSVSEDVSSSSASEIE